MTDRLTWLGHATVLVELGGAAVLTDPVLRRRVGHLRRWGPVPPAPPHVDVVLISHAHRDHLDLPSLRALDGAPVVVPHGAARALRHARREVREVAAGDALDVAGVRILAVPAVHDGRRSPLSPPTDALGYVIESDRRVYFAGDTGRFAGMAELTDLDVALVPIAGWGAHLGPGHMGPEDAAAAVTAMRPRVAVPIHWGTFAPIGWGSRHLGRVRDPASVFSALVAEHAPRVAVLVLMPGEAVALADA